MQLVKLDLEIFLIMKAMIALKSGEKAIPTESPEPFTKEKLLTKIRYLLKEKLPCSQLGDLTLN